MSELKPENTQTHNQNYQKSINISRKQSAPGLWQRVGVQKLICTSPEASQNLGPKLSEAGTNFPEVFTNLSEGQADFSEVGHVAPTHTTNRCFRAEGNFWDDWTDFPQVSPNCSEAQTSFWEVGTKAFRSNRQLLYRFGTDPRWFYRASHWLQLALWGGGSYIWTLPPRLRNTIYSSKLLCQGRAKIKPSRAVYPWGQMCVFPQTSTTVRLEPNQQVGGSSVNPLINVFSQLALVKVPYIEKWIWGGHVFIQWQLLYIMQSSRETPSLRAKVCLKKTWMAGS